MPVQAIVNDYKMPALDVQANFHGNQLLYIGWDRHLMFCASFAFAVSPDMTLRAFLDEVAGPAFAAHPEFDQVRWEDAEWRHDHRPFVPQFDQSLSAQGITHKSILRFLTPNLKGFQGKGV